MDIPLYKVWDFEKAEWFDSEAQARYVLDNAHSRLELMFFLAPAGVVLFADGSLGLVDKADGYRWAPLDPERFKVVWFTGKEDKDKKPIYSGHKIRCYKSWDDGPNTYYCAPVRFIDGCFVLDASENFNPCLWQLFDIEIVGHVYEHPELGAEA